MDDPHSKPDHDAASGKPMNIIITKLSKQPEYLLMIAIGLLGGGLGLGTTTVGLIKGNDTLTLLGFVSWVLLLLVSFLVIRFVKKQSDRDTGPMGPSLGGKAQQAFFAGGNAERLQGRWKVFWYEGEGENRKPYTSDPKEIIDLLAHKSKIMCVSFDESINQTYWLEGRLSDRGSVTLMYWSSQDRRISGLSGAVFMQVDDSFHAGGRRMKGWWRGWTRDKKITMGEVEWERMDERSK